MECDKSKRFKFNVSGKYFEVPLFTLEQEHNSMLVTMVNSLWDSDKDGSYFVDVDAKIFALVLDYLRFMTIEHIPDSKKKRVLLTARYLNMENLIEMLETNCEEKCVESVENPRVYSLENLRVAYLENMPTETQMWIMENIEKISDRFIQQIITDLNTVPCFYLISCSCREKLCFDHDYRITSDYYVVDYSIYDNLVNHISAHIFLMYNLHIMKDNHHRSPYSNYRSGHESYKRCVRFYLNDAFEVGKGFNFSTNSFRSSKV